MKNSKTNFITKIGILSALATVIMFLEFPIPYTPPFMKFDFSELVVLLGAFALGPLAGIFIELVKNLVHVASSITGGIGELANFVVGCAFVVPAALIYKKKKTIKNAILGLAVGSVAMVITAYLANHFVLIPLYVEIFAGQYNITPEQSLQGIIAMGAQENKNIIDLNTLLTYGIIPFNIIKVTVISLLTFVTYKKVSPILHK